MIRIQAYMLDKGVVEVEDPGYIPAILSAKETILWVDFDNPTETEVRLLSDIFNFHPLAIEDCLKESHHPKVDDYGEYLFIILHGIAVKKLEEGLFTEELDIFLGSNYLVTFHYEPRRSVSIPWQRCQQRLNLISRGTDFLLYHIVDTLVDNYTPVIEALDEKLDQIEEEVFSNPDKQTLNKIFGLRRDVLYLRRVILPQREVIYRLSRGEFDLVRKESAIFFRDVFDHLYRIADSIEAYRDVISGALEAYLSVSSNKLNEIMKVLTIITTIIMPLSLVVGIYGMNFEYMPELKWKHGYLMVWMIMIAIAGFLVWFFKKKKWL